MNIPVADVRLNDTHRLIPSKYSEGGTVLSRLSDDAAVLQELIELESGTNDRLKGEEGLLPGIGIQELVYGVSYAHIVNAAFTHAAPAGGRFNGPTRGAWYAGLERETSLAEVAFHKQQQLEEIDWEREEVSAYDDYLADFLAEMHDLRGTRQGYRQYLHGTPIPDCYRESQALAASLLEKRANGILYPSVRLKGGTCLVCFRPALVYHVRRGSRLEIGVKAGQVFNPKDAHEIEII